MSVKTDEILDKAIAGRRIDFAEGLHLMEHADLNALSRAAFSIRQRLHPEPIATYVIDRNINYTNICVADCDFCAFTAARATRKNTCCHVKSSTRKSANFRPSAARKS